MTGSAAAARDPAATAAARRGTESAAMCGDGEWERAGLRVRVLGFDRRREEGTGAGGQEGGFCLSGARNGNGGERREEGGRWRRGGSVQRVIVPRSYFIINKKRRGKKKVAAQRNGPPARVGRWRVPVRSPLRSARSGPPARSPLASCWCSFCFAYHHQTPQTLGSNILLTTPVRTTRGSHQAAIKKRDQLPFVCDCMALCGYL